MFLHRFTYRDCIAIASVLLCALLLLLLPYLFADTGERLVVATPEETFEYALSEDRTFEITSRGITLFVVIRDGEAYVKESDCPDGVCVASHAVSKHGETVLCAPAGVTLTVKGGERDVDFVAG